MDQDVPNDRCSHAYRSEQPVERALWRVQVGPFQNCDPKSHE